MKLLMRLKKVNIKINIKFKMEDFNTEHIFFIAFSFWSDISQLKFKPICKEHGCEVMSNLIPDITIQFMTSSQHNSFCKFHFSHTTLAHGKLTILKFFIY